MSAVSIPDLPTGYYLDNFEKMTQFVREYYADLLNDEELAFLETFATLSISARRFYVRLISRRGPVFRSDKLSYPEIAEDLADPANELAAVDLLTVNEILPVQTMTRLLLRAELVQLMQRHGGESVTGVKVDTLREWLEGELADKDVAAFCAELFTWFHPLATEFLLVFRLLFFGNLRQDLSEFVVSDLGHIRYEDYRFDPNDRWFKNRQLLDDTLLYATRRTLFYRHGESGDDAFLKTLIDDLPDTHGEVILDRRRGRLLFKIGRYFERLGDLETAMRCYEDTEYPDARQRRVMVMESRGDHEKGLVLANWLAEHGDNEFERDHGRRASARLMRRLGQKPPKRDVYRPAMVEIMLASAPSDRVEQAALDHYETSGTPGFYAENHLWCGLFGLVFWDIIYTPVHGAFFNRFQRGPADLMTTDFRKNRAELIDARLAEVQGGVWRDRVLQNFKEKHGRANTLVFWQGFTEELLDKVLGVLPDDHVAAIFERLSEDIASYRNGFPDLFLFTPNQDNGIGYKLVEVKGPGDQLQHNQRRWLRYFSARGIPAEVARIRWDAAT